jgi:membrane protein DedA with SNARE-associated domain
MHEIIQALIKHGYALLFLWVFVERLGIPIPATLPLIATGILIEMEYMHVIPALLLAFISVMLADISWYCVGRYQGNRILTFICRISLEPDACVRKAGSMFAKYGPASLIFTKFIPGLNSVIVPLVGTAHMPHRKFVAFDGIGSLLWVGFFIGLGYVFSREVDLEKIVLPNWEEGPVVIVIVILLVLFIVAKYLHRQYLIRDLFTHRITPIELKQKMDAGEEIAIVDVRHPFEFDADPFMIPGAVYFPLENLKHFSAVPSDRETVTYCS